MTAAVAVPGGLCGCRCGGRTQIATKTDPRTGAVKGQPRRFIHGHNARTPGGPAARRAPQLVDDDSSVERYALDLLAAAELIVGAVHDEGPDAVREAVNRALILRQPAGVDPVEALVVVLAAQINPDLPRSARVGWADTPIVGAG